MRKNLTAVILGAAAVLSFTAGCSDDPSPATTSSSATAPSATASSAMAPSSTADRPVATPAHTVPAAPTTTRPAATKPQGPNNGGTYEVPCTGPNQGTICTNPNHGAGTNPADNGTAPTTTTTKVRDDDPGGKPCTTGMGVPGVYVYSEDSQQWVCQIG